MSLARKIYCLLLWFALPFILARLFFRGFAQPDYWQHIAERFGIFSGPDTTGVIWIHAVSVGETRAAEPLIAALQRAYPDDKILLTCMTPTGRATAAELFATNVIQAYLPYDFPFAMRRLIAHFQPRLLLVMETEIWFNQLALCAEKNIPALLVNARMSEKSANGYASWSLIRSLMRDALDSLEHVVAQSETDANRLRLSGAKTISVVGNLKFDVDPDLTQSAKGQQWRGVFGNRPILLCASTRDGEEPLLLAAYKNIFDAAAREKTLLVIVPRHPARFAAVISLVEKNGLRVSRRSLNHVPAPEAEVWLGDSMGEMFAYLAMSDVVIIGGSFMPLGGQNLIEACSLGKPAIIGPSTFNFAEVTRLAIECGAVRQVENAGEAMRNAYQLLQEVTKQSLMAQAGIEFAKAHRGATTRTLEIIKLSFPPGYAHGRK